MPYKIWQSIHTRTQVRGETRLKIKKKDLQA